MPGVRNRDSVGGGTPELPRDRGLNACTVLHQPFLLQEGRKEDPMRNIKILCNIAVLMGTSQ